MSVRLDGVNLDHRRSVIGDVKLPLVGGERDAIGTRSFGGYADLAITGDMVDAALGKIGKIDAAINGVDDVVGALESGFGEDGDGAILLRAGDAAAAFGGQQPALVIESQAVGFVAVFTKNGKFSAFPFQDL